MDKLDKLTYIAIAIAAIIFGLIIFKQTERIEQLNKRVEKLELHDAYRAIKEEASK